MMTKKTKQPLITHILNIVTVALIVESFLCAMMAVRRYAREDCIDQIEEVTGQMNLMFNHAMKEQKDKLTVFADILAANIPNPDDFVMDIMENFCRTHNFTSVCIHRKNGTSIYFDNREENAHPHDMALSADFATEVARLPYVSEVFFSETDPEDPEKSFFYQAVPIVQNGETVAVLYGYISLATIPNFISSGMYDGKCRFYIIDGTTGNFLMDEHHGTLGNIDTLGDRETKPGYDQAAMREAVKNGESGEYVFKSEITGLWYYTYYMPMGINNWSIQITVDEPTAFQSYHNINFAMILLMVVVVVLLFIHVLVLMFQNARRHRLDKARLHKSAYINAVQRALLNAHSNAGFVDHALKLVGEEMDAETVLLLSFEGQTVVGAQYWPSTDKAQAMDMIGRNIRDDFPTIFDLILSGSGMIYDGANGGVGITEKTRLIFAALEVSNVVLVPVMDPVGGLKGAIAAINVPAEKRSTEMLECVTFDFFMAIANLENHNIIKRMGIMDYLTGIKNRNSYESEIGGYTTLEAERLWCVFIDVNGLHEVNNQFGHKAGDAMLISVAEAVKRVFGDHYTYRIGGDEFVSFYVDGAVEDLMKKKKAIIAELAIKGYHVSIGFAGIEQNADGLFDVEHVVADAESIMYEEKRKFYEENGIPSERGHFPPEHKKK